MSIATVAAPTLIGYGGFQPLLDWQAASIENLMQVQRFQFQVLAAWLRPFTAVNQELWGQWAPHFGVPMDG